MAIPRFATTAIALGAALLGGCGGQTDEARYDVTAQSASIDKRDAQGRCWQSDCSAPLTYVCAGLFGRRSCSTSRTGTAPQWFEVLLPGIDASALRSGLTVDYIHGSKTAADTTICHSNVALTDLILSAGHFDLPCGGANVVTLGLKAN